MSITPFATFRCLFKTFVAIVLLFTFPLKVHAALIDFDDLTYVPEDPEWPFFADTPVTNQYLSKGLSVSDGYLLPYDLDPASDPDRISGSNYLLAGNIMTLSFVGELPTYVGMYLGSFSHETIFADAYDTSGFLSSVYTAGDGGPYLSAPYVPKQYISFESSTGISRINISGFYGSRVSGFVDDLTFTYASVPEPSSFILFGLGMLVVAYRRFIGKN